MLASGTGDPSGISCQGTLFVDSSGYDATGAYPFPISAGQARQVEVEFTPSTSYTPASGSVPPVARLVHAFKLDSAGLR